MTTSVVVERKVLLAEVERVAQVARKGALPILGGVKLSVARRQFSVEATNLDVHLGAAVPSKVVGASASVVVTPKSFLTFVKLVPPAVSPAGERVVLTFTDDGGLEIAGNPDPGQPEFRPDVVGSPDDFPRLGEGVTKVMARPVTERHHWGSLQVDIAKRLALAASGDDARPILTAVSFEPDCGAATDSYRLAIASGSWGIEALVPARVFKLLGSEVDVWLTIDGSRPFYTWTEGEGNHRWGVARCIEGAFPNWRQLVPDDDGGSEVLVPAKEFKAAVTRADAVITALGLERAITPVQFIGNKRRLKVFVIGDGGASIGRFERIAEEVVPAGRWAYAAWPGVAVNSSYLLDGLKFLGKDAKQVKLSVRDPLKPALVTSPDVPGLTYLLMPVRVS